MRDDVDAAESVISLRNVALNAGDQSIVRAVTLDIQSGKPTVLIGPNGSGKTTLLRLAMGLISPNHGSITLQPGLVTAFVFQKPVMLRRSAAANLAFALQASGRSADAAAIENLLRRVNLSHVKDRPARKLSGGEQQRLALARALAFKPTLLFLDEPTASLDPNATKAVEDIIASVAAEGIKVVLATHDLGQARRLAGDVIFLVGGEVAEHSPAAQFFTSPNSPLARSFIAGDLLT